MGIFDVDSGQGDRKPKPPCVKNPDFYDVPGDGCDNDDDGKVDNPEVCDEDEDGTTAESFARGLGICTKASERGYGLVSAKFTRGYEREDAPMVEQHGLLPKFGNLLKPREGKRLGVLSTGYAQEFNGAPNKSFGESDARDWFGGTAEGNGSAPPGFPKGAEGCAQEGGVNDVVSLRLRLKAPKNASGFAFDFNFHTSEWPQYICSRYNDSFIAYLTAESFNDGKPDNISFDVRGNPVSVNNGFFDRCTKGFPLGCGAPALGVSKCAAGIDELVGTGFGIIGQPCFQEREATLGGATGWLFSQAPVRPEEELTLELMIWDTFDGILDSSVLIDNFRWILGDVVEPTTDRPIDVR